MEWNKKKYITIMGVMSRLIEFSVHKNSSITFIDIVDF